MIRGFDGDPPENLLLMQLPAIQTLVIRNVRLLVRVLVRVRVRVRLRVLVRVLVRVT